MSTSSSESTGSGLSRQLAHTDKTVRERAMVAVGSWLRRTEDVSRDDLLKLWKALYYCMWMADKVPVQQELAHQMAALIGQLKPKRALLFMDVFLESMVREWPGTDRHRIDKFYSLIRFSVLEILQFLVRKSWTVEFATELSQVLFSRLSSDAARGISLHIADLIVSELRKALSEVSPDDEIACEVLQILLQPLVEALTLPDVALTRRIRRGVFASLLKDAEAFGAHEDEGEEEEEEETSTLTTLVIISAGVLSDVFFGLASNPDVLEEGRHELYELRKGFRKINHLIEQGVVAEEEPREPTQQQQPDHESPTPDALEPQQQQPTPTPTPTQQQSVKGVAEAKSAEPVSGRQPKRRRQQQQQQQAHQEVVETEMTAPMPNQKKRRRRRQSTPPMNVTSSTASKDVFDVPAVPAAAASGGQTTLPAGADELATPTRTTRRSTSASERRPVQQQQEQQQTPKKTVTFSKKKLVRKFNHRTPIKVVESTQELIAKKSSGSVLRQTKPSGRARQRA